MKVTTNSLRQVHGRMRKNVVAYASTAMLFAFTIVPVGTVYASANTNSRKNETTKDWVCKYVTKPGGEERLKQGNDGLVWVDTHATEGSWFKDGQFKSYVLKADAPHSARPSVSSCPSGQVQGDDDNCPPKEEENCPPKDDAKDCPPKEEKPAEDKKDCPPKEVVVMPVAVAAPSVAVVCGANNDIVTMPTIEHVTYTQTGWVDGKNTVTATADAGYYIDGTQKDAEKNWTLTDENTSCGQVLGDTTTTPTVTPVVTTAVLEDTGATIAPVSVMGTVLIGIAALVFMSGARRQKLQEAINAIAL